MDHIQFKANQTAAGYVANGLDDSTQEAFELHMMGCSECVADVEVWRAIKLEMPRQHAEVRTLTPRRKLAAFSDWRMAASLVGAGVIGASGGWLGKATTATDLDATSVRYPASRAPCAGTFERSSGCRARLREARAASRRIRFEDPTGW